MGLHHYRSEPHNIHNMKRDYVYCIVHVQVQRIQSRTSKYIKKARDRTGCDPQAEQYICLPISANGL